MNNENETLQRQRRKLADAGYRARSCGASALGSKRLRTHIEVATDKAAECVAFVRSIGGTVAK